MGIKQKDIVILNLNPGQGREQKGLRPAVIISGNAFHVSEIAIVCPLTTSIKDYSGDIILKPSKENGLDEMSEVLVGHARSISIERVERIVGKINEEELREIFKGLDLIFDR